MKQKRFYTRLLPLLIPACTVDTPVAESESRFDDRLGADLGAWCETACDKFASCGLNDEDDCPEACFDSFTTTFVGNGDTCTEAALGIMDCIDGSSCTELSADTCNGQAARARCAASRGAITCESTGGSSGGAGGAAGGTAAPCAVQYDECADGHVYSVECSGSPRACHCMIDDYETGRFGNEGECPEAYEARQVCGWPIAPMQGEPSTRPVFCSLASSTGAAGGAAVDSCEIFFEDCSNAGSYGITCQGGTGVCTCREDGEPVGSFMAAGAVCPYVFDADTGAAALNAACGFSVAAPSLE